MTVLDDVVLEDLTDPEYDNTHAHIVPPDIGPDGRVVKQAVAKITEARIMGTPVEALCGFVWVPTKDAKGLAVCSKCKAMVGERVGDSLPAV